MRPSRLQPVRPGVQLAAWRCAFGPFDGRGTGCHLMRAVDGQVAMAEESANRVARRRRKTWSWADGLLGAVTGLVFLALYTHILLLSVLSLFRTRCGQV